MRQVRSANLIDATRTSSTSVIDIRHAFQLIKPRTQYLSRRYAYITKRCPLEHAGHPICHDDTILVANMLNGGLVFAQCAIHDRSDKTIFINPELRQAVCHVQTRSETRQTFAQGSELFIDLFSISSQAWRRPALSKSG